MSKICESSLRWIVNMRNGLEQLMQKNKNNVARINQINEIRVGKLNAFDKKADWFVKELDKYIITDGHSGGSFYWTLEQSKKIDKIGLEKWLTTDEAMGYGQLFSKIFPKQK